MKNSGFEKLTISWERLRSVLSQLPQPITGFAGWREISLLCGDRAGQAGTLPRMPDFNGGKGNSSRRFFVLPRRKPKSFRGKLILTRDVGLTCLFLKCFLNLKPNSRFLVNIAYAMLTRKGILWIPLTQSGFLLCIHLVHTLLIWLKI